MANCDRCGVRQIHKRHKGPLAGLFICRCGHAVAPKALIEAMHYGIPLAARNYALDACLALPTAPARRARNLGLLIVARALFPMPPRTGPIMAWSLDLAPKADSVGAPTTRAPEFKSTARLKVCWRSAAHDRSAAI